MVTSQTWDGSHGPDRDSAFGHQLMHGSEGSRVL